MAILQQLGLNEQGKITGGTLMPLANLDEREREVVRECLRAAVDGPFFPDWEFSTIFGLTRDEVKQVLRSWPELNEADESVVRAINRAARAARVAATQPEISKSYGRSSFRSAESSLHAFSTSGRAEHHACPTKCAITLMTRCEVNVEIRPSPSKPRLGSMSVIEIYHQLTHSPSPPVQTDRAET